MQRTAFRKTLAPLSEVGSLASLESFVREVSTVLGHHPNRSPRSLHIGEEEATGLFPSAGLKSPTVRGRRGHKVWKDKQCITARPAGAAQVLLESRAMKLKAARAEPRRSPAEARLMPERWTPCHITMALHGPCVEHCTQRLLNGKKAGGGTDCDDGCTLHALGGRGGDGEPDGNHSALKSRAKSNAQVLATSAPNHLRAVSNVAMVPRRLRRGAR